MRSRMITLPLVALALAASGCGGDDDSPGPAKADYINKADAICTAENASGEKETAAAVAKFGGARPTDAQATKLVTDLLLPNAEKQLAKLRSLEKPKADVERIDAIYDDIAAGIAAARKDPLSLLKDTSTDSPLATAATKAKAYGMKVCGGDG